MCRFTSPSWEGSGQRRGLFDMLKHTIIALAAMGAGLAGLSGGASAFPVHDMPAIGNQCIGPYGR